MSNNGIGYSSNAQQTGYVTVKKTLRQRLGEWLLKDYLTQRPDNYDYDMPKEVVVCRTGEELNVDPIKLNIYKASGGYVVETRVRDVSNHHRDYDYRLHIISNKDGVDLGSELSKILTMESLRG